MELRARRCCSPGRPEASVGRSRGRSRARRHARAELAQGRRARGARRAACRGPAIARSSPTSPRREPPARSRRGGRDRRPRRQRGPPGRGRLEGFSEEEMIAALRVNLESPVRMAAGGDPAMLDRGAGPPRLHLLDLRARPRYRAARCTRRPSSACAASRSRCARTCWGTGVGVSVVCPGPSATPGCSPTPGSRRRRCSAPPRPSRSARRWSRRSSAIAPRSRSPRCASDSGSRSRHRHPQLAARVTRGNAGKVADQMVSGRDGGR